MPLDVISMIGIAAAASLAVAIIIPLWFRIVVSTNDVHIVQSRNRTTIYGKGETAGNVYYHWPAWLPIIGVRTIRLPVSVFDQDLGAYAAYDKGRVPFVIDIMAFFRITNPDMAAQRVHTFEELLAQLKAILQGAVRTILASSEIEEILEGRSKFGEMFTKEVDHQLIEWGVQTVKQIELMDIRDASDSHVIQNIMAKKKSLIDMQSRTEVANNQRAAQTAEIEASREVEMRKQEAQEAVGIRTAQKEQQVGISKERAQQEIKEQARITAEKDMAVQSVQNVRKAEIAREVQVVEADQEKKTSIIKAEGHRQQTILVAEGDLQQTTLRAQGIQIEGASKAEAEKLMQLAPVQAQITLAKEIGENQGYQTYLISIRQIEANQAVGIEQAGALKEADVKVIANTGNAVEGVSNVMGLFTPKGGTQIGAALEALAQTDVGKSVVAHLTGGKGNGAAKHD